ncbi:MAG: hypothetical protein ACXW3M_05175, partial [Rhodoplanes sp.]
MPPMTLLELAGVTSASARLGDAVVVVIDAQRVSSSPSSETTRTGGGDDGTPCTMATTRSPGARDK